VNDSNCVEFLQWALPQLGMRWAGFRKVRRQICKRLRRRLDQLELPDLANYRAQLERHQDEWTVLESLTHITISRFNRDRAVFESLHQEVLPVLATAAIGRGAVDLAAWSAGCASGEEPYTLSVLWQLELAHRFPELAIRIMATDVDEAMLERAHRACYGPASLRELPERWRAAAFARTGPHFCVREPFRAPVTVARHDVRGEPPAGRFDLVLCRNLAFTYFDADLRRTTTARLARAVRAGGALVLGTHETLQADTHEFESWESCQGVYRRTRQSA
jgi:chemotaxis protein methyltransferase CheR